MHTMEFIIGGLPIVAEGGQGLVDLAALSAFQPFRHAVTSATPLRWLLDAEVPAPTGKPRFTMPLIDGRCAVYTDTGGDTLIELASDSHSMRIHYSEHSDTVCLSPCHHAPWLQFALWLAYNMQSSERGRYSLHCAAVVHRGEAVAFLGESGTGKSTHARLWCNAVDGTVLLNDDAPVFAVDDSGVWCYGSPWSGKTPCYRDERYPLRGLVRIVQAPANTVERLDALRQLAALVPSFPPMLVHLSPFNDRMMSMIAVLIRHTTVMQLHCLPDEASARLCCQTVFEQ